jgi:hypothetical protein
MSRKKAEEFVYGYISKIIINKDLAEKNLKLYKDTFSKMSDRDFKVFMEDLKSGKRNLSFIIPNGVKKPVTVANNIKVAKSLGISFTEHVFMTAPDGSKYKTPVKVLKKMLPVRRTVQTLHHGISVSPHNRKVNPSTGQVTGESKSTKITMPEMQILSGIGLKESVKEVVKNRGGDQGASRAQRALLLKQGKASQEIIDLYATGTMSKKVYRAYLNAMHLRSTL